MRRDREASRAQQSCAQYAMNKILGKLILYKFAYTLASKLITCGSLEEYHDVLSCWEENCRRDLHIRRGLFPIRFGKDLSSASESQQLKLECQPRWLNQRFPTTDGKTANNSPCF